MKEAPINKTGNAGGFLAARSIKGKPTRTPDMERHPAWNDKVMGSPEGLLYEAE